MSLRMRMHTGLARFRPLRRFYPDDTGTLVHRVSCGDGVELCVRELPAAAATPRARPVMLLHGLGSNHRGFHFPGRSLAAHLSARGHRVFLPELRGNGDSDPGGFSWTFDDHLDRDLPAIIAFIRAQARGAPIAWVGHSMGGILLLCFGIRHGAEAIERGITVGSALDYRPGHTGFAALLALRPLLERFTALPFGTFEHLISPLHGRLDRLDRFQVWPPNIEPSMIRRLHATAFHTLPISLLRSLAGLLEAEGLSTEDGLRFLDATDRYRIDTLMLGGSRDAQVSVEAVQATASRLGVPVQIFGRAGGEAEDYGHWDLLIGRRAPAETWPVITDFLER